MSVVASTAGAVAEAWQELRVHRLRVLLSLIVVAVSVAAFTGVVALGQMLSQGFEEQMERGGGRPALATFSAFGTGSDSASSGPAGAASAGSGSPADSELIDAAFARTAERFGVEWTARTSWLDAELAHGRFAGFQATDPDYGVMHRVPMVQGRWFSDTDAARLVPAVIVSENWWRDLGAPPMETHPTVTLRLTTYTPEGTPTAPVDAQAVIVGVTSGNQDPTYYSGYMVYDDALALVGEPLAANASREAWIPVAGADELMEAMRASLEASLPSGFEVSTGRTDYEFQQQQGYDPFGPMFLVLGGIAVLVLALGALSLLNITLVTVRHRIREIGVRRSFGATGTRIFFAVMLESVVATVLAGGAGIVLAILILRMPLVADTMFGGLQDPPPFPMSAAVIGLAVSAFVGALAGLLPALVAVRVRPIDAIRY
ncbi:ABC transporter permease [Microbacterium sp. NPDC096154]|uniref:ABC transporter permease n=1 Tax=Microbacterium sp. NPDC096154 TaxID=3155549 RepID=UPI0033213616